MLFQMGIYLKRNFNKWNLETGSERPACREGTPMWGHQAYSQTLPLGESLFWLLKPGCLGSKLDFKCGRALLVYSSEPILISQCTVSGHSRKPQNVFQPRAYCIFVWL